MKKGFLFRVRVLIDGAFHVCWEERGFVVKELRIIKRVGHRVGA